MTTATFDRLARSCSRDYVGGEEREIPCDIVEPPQRSMRRSCRGLRPAAGVRAQAGCRRHRAAGGRRSPAPPRWCFPTMPSASPAAAMYRMSVSPCAPAYSFRCADYAALALDSDGLRWGAELTLYPGSRAADPAALRPPEVRLPQQVLTNRREECQRLAEQVPVLERWIDAHAAQGTPFAVLGDFNRRLARERHTARDRHGKLIAMWPELDDGDPPEADLTNVTAGQPYRPCSLGERYRRLHRPHRAEPQPRARDWFPAPSSRSPTTARTPAAPGSRTTARSRSRCGCGDRCIDVTGDGDHRGDGIR